MLQCVNVRYIDISDNLNNIDTLCRDSNQCVFNVALKISKWKQLID